MCGEGVMVSQHIPDRKEWLCTVHPQPAPVAAQTLLSDLMGTEPQPTASQHAQTLCHLCTKMQIQHIFLRIILNQG